MRAVVLLATISCLALAQQATAQDIYDFTVKPEAKAKEQTLRIKPRLEYDRPELFEPRGSREGDPNLSLQVERYFPDKGTTYGFSFSRQLDSRSTSSPYRDTLSPKKGAGVMFNLKREF